MSLIFSLNISFILSLFLSFYSFSLPHTHTHILLPTDPSPFINLFTFFLFSVYLETKQIPSIFIEYFWVLRWEGWGWWKMSLWWCFGSTYSWDDDNSITNVWRFGSYPFYGLFPWDNSPSQKLTDTILNINKNIK